MCARKYVQWKGILIGQSPGEHESEIQDILRETASRVKAFKDAMTLEIYECRTQEAVEVLLLISTWDWSIDFENASIFQEEVAVISECRR
jgi:hypothetical protein